MFADVVQPMFLIVLLLVAVVKPPKKSPKKAKVQIRTKQQLLEEQEKERIRRQDIGKQKISFKKYKNRKMTPLQWIRLKFEFKQGLIPSRCVPLPLFWRKRIPEPLWWLPRIEKDGWFMDSIDYPAVKRALKYDYTGALYQTIRDYATGGNIKRHEGGNMVIVIEGLQRTGKSDLAKTLAKYWQTTQWFIRGRLQNPPMKPQIFVVLNLRELNEALGKMTSMDMLICDELDKWTGLGSQNRAEGYANLVARIAKTGKSFIFVSPEVRIPTIKQLAYLVLTTFGICYSYEATRFIVSKKSRYTQQYKLMGIAAMQRNWRYSEFREYHERKDRSIHSSEKRLGLVTGFDRVQVEKDREIIWALVYGKMYQSDDDIYYAYAITTADWRDYTMEFKDDDGEPLVDIEGLGGDYAKYVCKGLASRHKRQRTEWRIAQKKGKSIGSYAQEIDVSAVPKALQHVQIEEGSATASALATGNVQIDFRPMLNIPLEHNYVETMYDHRAQAVMEKWGMDTTFGKKIEGAAMIQLQNEMNDCLLSWRLCALGYSTRKTSRELTKEGYPRSHVTVLKHFNRVQQDIAGIMDELAFAKVHPHFTRVGGEQVKGQRDFVYEDKKGNILATISKKERNDKYWRPNFTDLSENEQADVIAGKPVFLVVTELETQRMQYWIVKLVTTQEHAEIIEKWKVLGKDIFVDMLGLPYELEGEKKG